nr:hypothetical protein [uncultured Allomuricauda sp.]
MKRAFIAVLIVFYSCSDNNTIEGTWIGAYKLVKLNGNQSYESLNTVIKIENNRFYNKVLGLKKNEGFDSFEFTVSESSIIPKDKAHMGFNIESLTTDSLVLSIPQLKEFKLVYRKLQDRTKKINWNPQGKSYHFQGNHSAAYAEYLNDSTMVEYDENHKNISINQWSIENFENYSFLMVKNALHTFPFLIDSISSKNVYLTSLEDKIRNYNYQLQTNIKPIDLMGIWRFKDKKVDTSLPEMPLDYFPKNQIEKLIIAEDFLELKFRGSETSEKYNWTTSTSKKLIFLQGEEYQILKILNLSSDELEIEIESNENQIRLSYLRE